MAINRPAKRQTERGPGDTTPPGEPPKRRRPPPGGGDGAGGDGPAPGTGAPDAAVVRPGGIARLTRFVGEVSTELRKVSWPNRSTLFQATLVVLIVVAVIAVYLAALDAVFERLVDAIF